MMEKSTVCVIFKTKPGMRENLKTAWEEYIKPHVITNNDIFQHFYNFSIDDPDTVCMFEVLSDINVLSNAYEQPWMKEYFGIISPLLAEKPQVLKLNPVWMKDNV
jgi:quinol monooxygenase YgiN